MRIYGRTLIPATTFFVISCLLSSLLPVSGARWQELLTISGNIESIQWTPSPPPQSQAGTTLSATKTATGFAEERDGVTLYGVRGEICVANGGEYPTKGLFILDTLQSKIGKGQFQDYISKPVDVSAKPVLEAGREHCYSYEFTFTPIADKNTKYRNSVSVTILNHSGWLPGGNHCEGPEACPFGPNPNTDFILPEEVIVPTETPSPEPVIIEVPTNELPPVLDPLPTEPSPTDPPANEPPVTEPSPSEPPPTDSPSPTEPPSTIEPLPTETPTNG